MAQAATRKIPETAPEPSLADAVAKTGLLIQKLRSRLDGTGGADGTKDQPGSLSNGTPAGQEVTGEAVVDVQLAAANPQSAEETSDDLEEQLQHYFNITNGKSASSGAGAGANAGPSLETIRDRVIDGVVDKIIREWEQPGSEARASLEGEVMERLVRKVLERLR